MHKLKIEKFNEGISSIQEMKKTWELLKDKECEFRAAASNFKELCKKEGASGFKELAHNIIEDINKLIENRSSEKTTK